MNEEQLQQAYEAYIAEVLKRGSEPLPFPAWEVFKDEPFFQRRLEHARAVEALKAELEAILLPPLERIANGLTRFVDWLAKTGAKHL